MDFSSSIRRLEAFQPAAYREDTIDAEKLVPFDASPVCVSPLSSPKTREFVATASDVERAVSPDISSQVGNEAMMTQGAPNHEKKKTAKRAPKSRRKWKKPADKPKRPLSAYNLYFKDQREKIIRGEVKNWTQARGFRAMAQFIAKKWNNLDSKSRTLYEARATEEKKGYFIKLAQWKRVKKQRELLEEMTLLQLKGKNQFGMPMMSYSNMFQESCFSSNETIYNSAVSANASCHQSQESLEPLPVDFALNTTVNSDLLAGASSFGKSYESFADSLQDVLDCTSEPQSRRGSLGIFNQSQLRADHATGSVMKRVLATFDVLDVDDEFADFMSSMEWK